jgi:UDPglucose 6-dehydrogenase
MNVGVVGLGKLGMPVALAISLKGHDVMGHDVRPEAMQKRVWPYLERGPNGEPSIEPLLRASDLRFGTLHDVIEHAELVFVVVQTPHAPEYEGTTRVPAEPRDFDYLPLHRAFREVASICEAKRLHRVVAIISTVLPGTLRRWVMPWANRYTHVCHTPFFEAMGSVVGDFFNREFALCGAEDAKAAATMARFYESVTDAPQVFVSLESAEAIKVFYNTFASLKVVFANTVMEVCHKTPGADCDEVADGLALATQRLLSPMYLRGGMGDGGVCHPRDNIALSWLAQDRNMSFDLFGAVMHAREAQAEWLVDLMCQHDLPKVILGKSFKAGSNITTGSACVLVANLLRERGIEPVMVDPRVDVAEPMAFDKPAAFLVAMNHPEFRDLSFPEGSVVIDVWRYMPQQPSGVTLIPVGVGA